MWTAVNKHVHHVMCGSCRKLGYSKLSGTAHSLEAQCRVAVGPESLQEAGAAWQPQSCPCEHHDWGVREAATNIWVNGSSDWLGSKKTGTGS